MENGSFIRWANINSAASDQAAIGYGSHQDCQSGDLMVGRFSPRSRAIAANFKVPRRAAKA